MQQPSEDLSSYGSTSVEIESFNPRVVRPPRLINLKDLILGKTIGTGTFGRVRIARYSTTEKYFALKIMKKTEVKRLNQVEHVFSERAILSMSSHPFIVKLYSTFQDDSSLYMLMEYVIGGDRKSVV